MHRVVRALPNVFEVSRNSQLTLLPEPMIVFFVYRSGIPVTGSSCSAPQGGGGIRLCHCFVPMLVPYEKNALVDVFNTNNGLAWPRVEGSGWDNPNSDPV